MKDCDAMVQFYNEHIASVIKIQSFCRNFLSKKNKEPCDEMYELYSIIKNNDYIKKCKSNKKKDVDSLSYLIDIELSQSDCIKLGNCLEKVFYDIVLHYTSLTDIKPKNKKGVKEKDHLFCDDAQKIIYYSEFKSNINLDTEKSKSTYQKCLNIVTELEKQYPEHIIKWCLLGCRYINNEEIPNKLKYKYTCIKHNLFGVNDYLHLLNINIQFTHATYCDFLNNIAKTMIA
jgi:hypothetical protein